MIAHEIPLPRLLNSSGGTERRIRPISCSVNLNIIPLSYASMELPIGEDLPARGYVEVYTSLGSAGIYRVRSPQDAYGMDSTTAELEHAIVEVGDYLVLQKYDSMMAADAAMQAIFSHYRGSRWQLGSVTALGNTQIAVQCDHERVLEAMLALLDQKPDCMMAFDFTTTPWTVSIVARATTVSAEGRLSRNVNSAKIIYDDTELCTRVYYSIPSTKDASAEETASIVPTFDASKNYSSGSYVSKDTKVYRLTDEHTADTPWAQTSKTKVSDSPDTTWTYKDADTLSTYGLVEGTISVGKDYTASEAEFAATEYLKKHKEPRVTVDVSAEELSYATGETLDTFTVGKLCRLALADYGVTVERTITALSWSDVYSRPFDITVTLADEEDTAVTFLHDMDSKGGGGGGGGSKKKEEEKWKEYWTKSTQDDYHFELMAVRVNEMNNILQQAGLYIDSDGVIQYARDNENMWASHLQVQADRISLVVEGTGENATIKAAQIVAAITAAGSSIKISATNIDIDGLVTQLNAVYATIGSLDTVDAKIDNLTSGATTATSLRTNAIEATSGTFNNIVLGGQRLTQSSATVVTGSSFNITLPFSRGTYGQYATTSNNSTISGSHSGYLLFAGDTSVTVTPTTSTIHFIGSTSVD